MDTHGSKKVSHAIQRVEHIFCNRCHAQLDAGDNFCRHCGAPTVLVVEPAEAQPWLENRWLLMATLFFALGPLGLPLLWKGRSIGAVEKIVVSLLVILESVALGGLVWYSLRMLIKALRELS